MANRFGSLVVLAALCGLFGNPAFALPSSPTLVSGSASFSIEGDTLNITADNATLDWSSFSVSAGQTVNFIQPLGSTVNNRLIGNSVLDIFGLVRSNGRLVLQADSINVALGGIIDAAGLSLLADQNVSMAGLIQGSGLLTITAPAIYVKGPLISDGVVLQSEDYYGSGTLNLGSNGGSFSAVEVTMVNFPFPEIDIQGPGEVALTVPEPASLSLLMAGLLGVFGLRHRGLGRRVSNPI